MIDLEDQMRRTQIVKEVRQAIRDCYGYDFEKSISKEDAYELSRFLLIVFNQVVTNKNYK